MSQSQLQAMARGGGACLCVYIAGGSDAGSGASRAAS